MGIRRGLLLLALLFLSFLLEGCGAPAPVNKQIVHDDGGNVTSYVDLSKERIAEIRNAFIGRSFIFKEDWYEYSIIDSDPLGGFSDPVPITTFPNWLEGRNYQVKVASAGTVAKIVGVRMYRDGITFICETEKGKDAYLVVINHRPWTVLFGSRNTNKRVSRASMDDDLNTVAWIERNLTYHSVEFIENLPEVPDVDLAFPEPELQPTLTPVPVGVLSPALVPTIRQLTIQTDPPLVHNNQVLNLVLDYSVDTAGLPVVQVAETRTLLLDGNVLPGYPKTINESRASGRHTNIFQQMIPPRAKAGPYTYFGEVCIADDCISRSKTFQVAP